MRWWQQWNDFSKHPGQGSNHHHHHHHHHRHHHHHLGHHCCSYCSGQNHSLISQPPPAQHHLDNDESGIHQRGCPWRGHANPQEVGGAPALQVQFERSFFLSHKSTNLWWDSYFRFLARFFKIYFFFRNYIWRHLYTIYSILNILYILFFCRNYIWRHLEGIGSTGLKEESCEKKKIFPKRKNISKKKKYF